MSTQPSSTAFSDAYAKRVGYFSARQQPVVLDAGELGKVRVINRLPGEKLLGHMLVDERGSEALRIKQDAFNARKSAFAELKQAMGEDAAVKAASEKYASAVQELGSKATPLEKALKGGSKEIEGLEKAVKDAGAELKAAKKAFISAGGNEKATQLRDAHQGLQTIRKNSRLQVAEAIEHAVDGKRALPKSDVSNLKQFAGTLREEAGHFGKTTTKGLMSGSKGTRFLTGKNAAIGAGIGAVGYVGYKMLGGGRKEEAAPVSFAEREEMRRAAAAQEQGRQ